MNHFNVLIIIILMPFMLTAQERPDPVTPDEIKEVVDSVGDIIIRTYVYPEVGEKIAGYLQMQLREGAYDGITDPVALADVLTRDIRAMNNDRHLSVRFAPEMIAEHRNTKTRADSMAHIEKQRQQGRNQNYGFREVTILEGNIGYLKLDGFFGVTEEAGETAAAAMNFLSHTDALIIDLRENGGGSPQMIQLITSYLYDPEPVHLNSFYFRPADETTQTWTLPYVPGNRMPETDVYVLTSQYTFSAAEEFSYNLKNLKRATLVGETTGGGAHPGGTQIATDRFIVWVPTGRAINPVTKKNWEGTGVEPHIHTPADQALVRAQIEALEKLKQQADGESLVSVEWALQALEAKQNPPHLTSDELASCTGSFGPRHISLEDGKLYYQRDGRPKLALQPLSKDLFSVEGIPYFRIKVIRENDQVPAIVGLYRDGRMDKNLRTDQGKSQP